jgi:transmembrane sensor
MAVAAALLVMIGIGALTLAGLGRSSAQAVILATRIGEIRADHLKDGTTITLDTDTRVEARITSDERRIALLHGRARFAVATDAARPFVVSTARGILRANAGVLDVSAQPLAMSVSIISGSADVRDAGGKDHQVETGQALSVDPANSTTAVPSVPADVDWTTGMFNFDNAPLVSVIDAANRYSTQDRDR